MVCVHLRYLVMVGIRCHLSRTNAVHGETAFWNDTCAYLGGSAQTSGNCHVDQILGGTSNVVPGFVADYMSRRKQKKFQEMCRVALSGDKLINRASAKKVRR